MGKNIWTKEQNEAINERYCNLLVAAGAGAGKTAVLVERIIKRVMDKENPVDIDNLLVVTFTNAAASEMRERIADALIEELDKDPSNKRLATQLTLLNKAMITTIHSFCLEVIKNNFHIIDLDPAFRIGDDTETLLIKTEVIEELFENLYENHDNDWFLSLLDSYSGTKSDLPLQNIILELHDFVKATPWPEEWLYNAAEAFNIQDDFDFNSSKWAKVIMDNIKIELYGILEAMNKAIEKIKNTIGLDEYLINFEEETENIKELINLTYDWDSFYKKINEINFTGLKRCSKDADKKVKEEVTNIRNEVKAKIKEIRDKFFFADKTAINDEIKKLYPYMEALSKIVINFEERYATKKREKGIIDFSDIEHFALNILVTKDKDGNRMPSDTAKAYSQRFEEIFIDEYQDSNLVQEVILEAISRIEIPNRFMVGDVKQSIYRFRQAKPELFLEKYNNYPIGTGFRERKILLYKNFRSRIHIINGINYIFKKIMSKNIGEIDYTDEEKLNYGASFELIDTDFKEDAIEINLIEKEEDFEEKNETNNTDENDEYDYEEDVSQDEEIDVIQAEVRVISKRIKELIKNKEVKIYDKQTNEFRYLEYKDIVILLRATTNWAEVFLEELIEDGIPAFADIGTGYFETSEVKTIISLLQIIDNPIQDIPMLAVLRSPIFSFTEGELIEIRAELPDNSIYEAVKKIADSNNEIGRKSKSFLSKLSIWQEKAVYMPVDEFIWYLYTDTGYYGYVGAMTGGIQRQANLRVLFERAKQYEETSFKGLFNFINFINKLKVSSKDMGSAKILGENENVVRIMSIHKSKGLEFPVVIVAGLGKQFNLKDLNKTILYHHLLGFGPEVVDYKKRISYPSIVKEGIRGRIKLESLSEEMRILYVAFTRAKEKLILVGSIKDIKNTVVKWYQNLVSDEKLPQYQVLKAKNYLDWIGPAIITHSDLENLRKLAGIDQIYKFDENSRWKIKLWNKNMLTKNISNFKYDQDILKELDDVSTNVYNYDLYDLISKKLNYIYPYKEATKLPAKLSVTEIKRMLNEEVLDDETTSIFQNDVLKTPAFLEGEKKITGAERGAIMHLVMQKLNLNYLNTTEDIIKQINDFILKEIITEDQAKVINIKQIKAFFESPLGNRMLKAKNISREVPFHIELSSTQIYKNLPSEYEHEFIQVQGIIDCFFEEKDGLVLLDYKTDFVKKGREKEIANKYKIQIDLYSRALETLTGKKVKEKYLYLFQTMETVLLD
ncbi:MAG: helicase-exonuclease AddAB subunit AddA [Thermoanaerobacteraceae bacterium]